jgi:hypothetical protein
MYVRKACIRTCTGMYRHVYIQTQVHTKRHTYIHTSINQHTHIHTHAYIHTCRRTHMHTYTHTYSLLLSIASLIISSLLSISALWFYFTSRFFALMGLPIPDVVSHLRGYARLMSHGPYYGLTKSHIYAARGIPVRIARSGGGLLEALSLVKSARDAGLNVVKEEEDMGLCAERMVRDSELWCVEEWYSDGEDDAGLSEVTCLYAYSVCVCVCVCMCDHSAAHTNITHFALHMCGFTYACPAEQTVVAMCISSIHT